MSPITLGIQVSDIESLIETKINPSHSTSNLASYKCLTTNWWFMIEQYSITCIHTITLTIVDRNPICIHLCCSIWTPRIEWWFFRISCFWHIKTNSTKHLRCRCLIKSGFFIQSVDTNSLKKTKCADSISICSIFWHIKTHLHMRLCGEIIYLIWLYISYELDQICRIRHITIVEIEFCAFFMNILEKMIDSWCIQGWCSSLDSMNFISFFEKKLCKIGSVLSGNTGNKCFFDVWHIRK